MRTILISAAGVLVTLAGAPSVHAVSLGYEVSTDTREAHAGESTLDGHSHSLTLTSNDPSGMGWIVDAAVESAENELAPGPQSEVSVRSIRVLGAASVLSSDSPLRLLIGGRYVDYDRPEAPDRRLIGLHIGAAFVQPVFGDRLGVFANIGADYLFGDQSTTWRGVEGEVGLAGRVAGSLFLRGGVRLAQHEVIDADELTLVDETTTATFVGAIVAW